MKYCSTQRCSRPLQAVSGWKVCLAGCLLSVLGSGCTSIFSRPVMSGVPQTLPWLSGMAAPVDTAPPFDLAQIQPLPRPGLAVDDMLEVTIWDLYEPGKPHTFPARVDGQGQISVPHLDPVPVSGTVVADVESRLIEAYRRHELLKQPRVLVRELGSAPLHIYVTGAVLRPGLINLPRRDASVFSALIAAGGLSRNAGLHVLVSDQGRGPAADKLHANITDPAATLPLVAGNSGIQLPPESTAIPKAPEPPFRDQPPTPIDDQLQPPAQHLSNHSEALTVSDDGHSRPEIPGQVTTDAPPAGIVEGVATRPDFPSSKSQSESGRWYDLSVDRDREMLKQLVLHDGDVVTVRPAAPPVRISGAVAQPGSYRAPAGNTLTLVDAIQLAGGFGASDLTMAVVLTRPATSESSLQRWSFRMGHGEKLPAHVPFIQPGDLIHVEPTARARVQSLVGAVWPGK